MCPGKCREFVEIRFTFRGKMAKMTVKSTSPAGKCTKFPRIPGTFPEGAAQNDHHAPVPSPEMQVFLARRYRLLLALRPPETHPMSSQIFCKSLIINKLPKHILRLGMSESTQRQPHFCNLLIIRHSKIERWLWGENLSGNRFFGHEDWNAVKNRQAKSNFHSFVTSPINPSSGHY